MIVDNKKELNIIKILGFISLVAQIILFSSCRSNNSDTNEYQKLVKTAPVEQISSIVHKQFPGLVEEAKEVDLAFRVAGPIARIFVKEGQSIKKGQLVAQMDTRDYLIQKNALETQVRQLRSEYDRIAELHRRGSVADNDYEKMKAGKEMAEEQLKNAVDQLNDTKLYAPFTGYISEIRFKEGEMVNHGTPIARIIDVSLLKIDVHVPASMYIHKDNITEIVCTQDNLPGETFSLTLSGFNIKANSNGLYKFYMNHQPHPNSKLLPGMNVLVKISYSTEEDNFMRIPVEALYAKNGNSYVWVVKENKVHAREVMSNNIVKNGRIGIINGLRPGEQVVIGGLNLLSEGEEVQVVAPQSETNIGNIL